MIFSFFLFNQAEETNTAAVQRVLVCFQGHHDLLLQEQGDVQRRAHRAVSPPRSVTKKKALLVVVCVVEV